MSRIGLPILECYRAKKKLVGIFVCFNLIIKLELCDLKLWMVSEYFAVKNSEENKYR